MINGFIVQILLKVKGTQLQNGLNAVGTFGQSFISNINSPPGFAIDKD